MSAALDPGAGKEPEKTNENTEGASAEQPLDSGASPAGAEKNEAIESRQVLEESVRSALRKSFVAEVSAAIKSKDQEHKEGRIDLLNKFEKNLNFFAACRICKITTAKYFERTYILY